MKYIAQSEPINLIFHIGKNTLTVHRQKIFKYKVINNAALLFCLGEKEREKLANKAGLSFAYGQPMDFQENFHSYFNSLIDSHEIFKSSLAETISERMFEYFCNGMIPSKESTLTLGISLGLNLENIQLLLGQAGYCLSRSLPADMIAWWFIKYQNHNHKKLFSINEVLYNCDLPLLMTRKKI